MRSSAPMILAGSVVLSVLLVQSVSSRQKAAAQQIGAD